MPWRCPACQTPVPHNDNEDVPRVGARYRCPICRLELAYDPAIKGLNMVPMEAADDASTDPADKKPAPRTKPKHR